MKIYEAFTPSGTEQGDYSHGLFTGEPEKIKALVAEKSPWRADRVRLSECVVTEVTGKPFEEIQSAKQNLRDAKERAQRLGLP